MRIELSANKLTRVLLLYNTSWKFYYFRSVGESEGKKDRGILSRGNNRANRRWCNRFWWILNLIERRHFLPIKLPSRFYRVIISRGARDANAAFDFQLAGKFFPRPCLCSDFPRWSLRIAHRLSVLRACFGEIIRADKKKGKKGRKRTTIVKMFKRVWHWKMLNVFFCFFFT